MKLLHVNKRLSLKVYYFLVSVITLCIACLISCGLVVLEIYFFYEGEITVIFTISMCLLVCIITMFIGSYMLFRVTNNIAKPIEKVTKEVSKVTTGDFSVYIPEDFKKPNIEELNALIDNFNKMAKELNSMDYMRKDFMSNVSHEVKTPIAAIAGFTEILLDDGLSNEEREEYLNLVYDEAIGLSRLCENMLCMSRIDSQQIIMRYETIRIDEQIRKCIIMLSEKWDKKFFEFCIDLMPIEFESDPDMLQQIWINVIDNAMKYSPRGSTIYISGKEENNRIVIKIKDEGIGIPKEKQAHIFEKFYQCEESRKKNGSGLGLSIVKRILELLDGKIICNSEESVGTEMIIILYKKV